MDTKFSTAVHILIFTSEHEDTVTSEALARSVGTNPSHIRKILTALKTAGLIHSSQGKKGIHLAQPKESITLDTIYRAVYPDKEPDCRIISQKFPDILVLFYCIFGINVL